MKLNTGFLLTVIFSTTLAWGQNEASASENTEHQAQGKTSKNRDQTTKIIGYLPSYRVNPAVITQLENYTDIVYFGSEIKADGGILLTQQGRKNLEKLSKVKGEFNLHFCLGGWGKDKHFPSVTEDPAKRKKLLQQLAQLQKKYHFKGIDYDWEYPRNAAELKNFAILIKETQEAFPAAFEVTAAFNPRHNVPESLWKHLDRVHLMTYDLGPEHCSITHAESAIKQWKKRGVPANKLTIGAAFYARKMNDRNKVLTYAQLVKKHGAKTAIQNKLDGYFYDNQTTLKKKLNLVKREKISGMIIWEIGQDSADETSLGKFLQNEK